jgi:hypothetical protein
MYGAPAEQKIWKTDVTFQGRIQDFKLGGGAHLKKLRRAEGGAKFFGIFRVKNHDFTPKKSYLFTPLDPPLRFLFWLVYIYHIFQHWNKKNKINFTPNYEEKEEKEYVIDQLRTHKGHSNLLQWLTILNTNIQCT